MKWEKNFASETTREKGHPSINIRRQLIDGSSHISPQGALAVIKHNWKRTLSNQAVSGSSFHGYRAAVDNDNTWIQASPWDVVGPHYQQLH